MKPVSYTHLDVYKRQILDGFGENPNNEGNAVNLAKKPNIDKLRKICPVSHIDASGAAVGLPDLSLIHI